MNKKSQNQNAVNKRKSSKSSKAGQFLGYSIQTTRMLELLLELSRGWYASLECFEDVGAEGIDGSIIAQQCKSSTSDINPLADHGVGLWKTISNWVDMTREGCIDPNRAVYEIYSTNHAPGKIASIFDNSKNYEEAETGILKAINIISKSNIPKTIKKYYDNICKYRDIATKIIEKLNIRVGSGCSYDDLKNSMSKTVVPEDILDDSCLHMLGWIKAKVEGLIEKRKEAIVLYDDFRLELESYIRVRDRRTILSTFAGKPSEEEIEKNKLGNYIDHLERIDADEDTKIQAVIYFLKSAVDRVEWAKRGWVHQSSFDDYEKTIIRHWKNQKGSVNIELEGHSGIKRGKVIYHKCMIYTAILQGIAVPDHFTPGSYHALCDRDLVWWHPDFNPEEK